MLGERRVESERRQGAATRVRHVETLSVTHSHMAIHRLIEMA